MTKRKPDVMEWGPGDGEAAYQFCWHDREGIELRTKDGRVLATYRYGQLRPCNPNVWADYFTPPVFIDEKGGRAKRAK